MANANLFGYLSDLATKLEAAAGASISGNTSTTGYWKRVAAAAETYAGSAIVANENLSGYMHRTAEALRTKAGLGATYAHNDAGHMATIAAALEAITGISSSGSYWSRISLAISGGITPAVAKLLGGLNLVALDGTTASKLGPQRNYTNLAKYSRWTNASGTPIYEPDVVDGELVSLTTGVAPRKSLAALPRIDGGGVVRVRAEWTGATTGTFSGSATSNQTNGGSGSTGRWAECDVTVPADRSNSATSFIISFSSTTVPPQNLWISELAHIATRPLFDPQWIADFNAGPKPRQFRWMDWGRTNANIWGDDFDPDMEFQWANRAMNPTAVQPKGNGSIAGLIYGTGDASFRIEPWWYYQNPAAIAAFLPENAFARTARLWSFTIAAPSGAGSVVRDGVDPKNLIVTPPASGVVNDLIAMFNATPFYALFRARLTTGTENGSTGSGASGASTGTGTIGATAKRQMIGGTQAGGAGPPLDDVIAFHNAIGVPPYICLQFRASVDFAVNFVEYLNANLSSACKPFDVELGNEWWNTDGAFIASGMNMAWGIKEGLIADTSGGPGPYHFSRMVQLFAAMSAAVPRGASTWRTVANVQAASAPAQIDTMEAWPGLSALVDVYASAPYASAGKPVTSLDEAYSKFISNIESAAVPRAVAAHNRAAFYGKKHIMYEAGPHDTWGGAALYNEWQASDEMGDALHYYFSEMQFAVPDDTLNFFLESFSIVGDDDDDESMAWGLKEYVGQPLADAPKQRAYNAALLGQWKPYIRLGHEPVTSGSRLVGQPLTADWTVIRRATSGSYQWFNEDGDIPGATASTYVQQASDAGKHVECRITGITDYGSVVYETTGAGVTTSGYEAEATALFARMSVQPNDARKGAINNVYLALKNGALSGTNLLTKIRSLYVLAAHDAQAALLDWASTDTLSLLGSPTFAADQGYTGVNTALGDIAFPKTAAAYGAEGSPKFTQDSAHIMGWATFRPGANDQVVGRNIASGGNLMITNQGAVSGNSTVRINANTGTANNVPGALEGPLLANRSGATAVQFYRNGVVYAGSGSSNTEASTPLQANTIVLLKAATQTVRFAGIGLSLTANEQLDYYNALRAYATAVGLP